MNRNLIFIAITMGFLALNQGCAEDNPVATPEQEQDAATDAMMGGGELDAGMNADAEPMMEPDDCVSICETVTACFQMECMDLDEAGVMAINADCIDECTESRGFRTITAGIDECSEMVDFVAPRLSNSALAQCGRDPGNPPQNEGCAIFAARYTECVMERCEGGRAVRDIFEGSARFFCDSAADRGELRPEDLANFANPSVPCDSPQLANAITDRLMVNPNNEGSGDLAELCNEGPVRDGEECLAACENFGPCIGIDDDSAVLRNNAQCAALCVTNREFLAGGDLQCITQAECNDLQACFSVPEFEECVGFAATVTDCMEAECANISLLHETLEGFIQGFCNEQMQSGELNEEIIASVLENTCADERTRGWVQYFVEGFPQDPNSGPLRNFCEEGPLVEPAICERACARIAECEEEEEEEVKDEARCRYICMTTDQDIPSGAWQCVDESDSCLGLGACFQ